MKRPLIAASILMSAAHAFDASAQSLSPETTTLNIVRERPHAIHDSTMIVNAQFVDVNACKKAVSMLLADARGTFKIRCLQANGTVHRGTFKEPTSKEPGALTWETPAPKF